MTGFIYNSVVKRALYVSAGLMGGLLLSACVSSQNHAPKTNAYPIEITESFERLELYTRQDGLELSVRDREFVRAFMHTYDRYGDGPLYVNVPGTGQNVPGVQQAQKLIHDALVQVGGNPLSLQVGRYQIAPGAPAPVIISFRQLKTLPRNCHGSGILTETHSNDPYAGFGCSYTANFAAMVQDARQLLGPYQFTSPDGPRRITIYDKYIAGENPASIQPDRQEIGSNESSE